MINVSDLNAFDEGATIDAETLIDAGLVPDSKLPVKVLGNGELKKKLTLVVKWYSKSALEKIAAAGGTTQNLKGAAFELPKVKKKFVKRDEPASGKKAKAAEADAPAAEASAPAPVADAPPAE